MAARNQLVARSLGQSLRVNRRRVFGLASAILIGVLIAVAANEAVSSLNQVTPPAVWAGAASTQQATAIGAPVARLADARPRFVAANGRVPDYQAPYRYGINFGWREGWTNVGLATIAAEAGATSARIKLPEWLFAEYGYTSELDNRNMATYEQVGLRDLTAFLIGPARAHSKAPPNADLDLYSPKNLYKPIWTPTGQVNPENYWATYVYNTVSTYKRQVRTWEVWNEPDFVHNWNLTQYDWWRRPPQAAELPFWNDSVFAYVRLLRVTYEVAKAVDPDCLIATGGIGYESFLDALLRYSDNPADGVIDDQYPATGGAYFDVLSFHHYPQYAIKDMATETWYFDTDSDAAADSLLLKRRNLERQLISAGYDGQLYPAKLWLATETGIASKPINKEVGGVELMQNYLVKHAVLAQTVGIKQVHWYSLTDQESRGAATKAHDHMGLYYDIKHVPVGRQELKPAAWAYATVAKLLSHRRYDPVATATLTTPAGVRAYAFRGDDGKVVHVMWARTSDNREVASANFDLPSTQPQRLYGVSHAHNGESVVATPANGVIRLRLTAEPLFAVADDD